MRAALIELAENDFKNQWDEISARLRTNQTDSFRFRKESAAPSGLISWRQGEDLISSARSTLIAGAKAHLERARRYSNRLGQFAGRYLDNILMGQTAAGSYIITAYAPTTTLIPISSSQSDTLTLPGTDTVESRAVTASVSKALEAAQEALEHYRSTGSFSAFEDGVHRGISYELTTALRGVTKDSDGGEILIEWDPSNFIDPSSPSTLFEFKGSDSAVLETASARLGASAEGAIYTNIVGRVHLLTKKHAGGPGVFGIESIANHRKYRVRLQDPEQYREAVHAHDEDLALQVSGNLERDGMISWIYDAQIQGTVGPVETLAQTHLTTTPPLALPITPEQLELEQPETED
ncbi:hypothetical protein ACWGPQ_12530 [Saccharomonospora azurea]